MPHLLGYNMPPVQTPMERTTVGRGNGHKYMDMGSFSYQPQGIGATRSDADRTKGKMGSGEKESAEY